MNLHPRCCHCGHYFAPKDKQCYTILTNADPTLVICEECSEIEEDMAALKGTKNLPELLNTYNMR